MAPRSPPTVARPCSRGSPLLRQGPTSRGRASSATAPRLPDADQTAPACGRPRDLPVPAQGASAHARVSDRAGSSSGSRSRHPPCCLPLSRRRRHPGADFRGSMAGLCDPLSTLRHALAGRRRMTRGQCGLLNLRCKGLPPSTPCRSPDAFSCQDLVLAPTSLRGPVETSAALPEISAPTSGERRSAASEPSSTVSNQAAVAAGKTWRHVL